jgi:Ice-binding-like
MRICLRREVKNTNFKFRQKPCLRRLIMNHFQKHLSACLIALAALFSTAWAQAITAPTLSTATLSFGALGGMGVTCDTPPALPAFTVTGNPTGNVGSGLQDFTYVTGFLPPGTSPNPALCTLSGTVQGIPDTDAVYAELFAETTGVYSQLASNNLCPTLNISNNLSGNNLSGDLGGMTLPPGVYCLSGVVTLNNGTLTLDPAAPGGDGGTEWIFIGQGDPSITTDGTIVRSKVVMAPGGNTCDVYWQLSSALTLSSTDFVGNVLAGGLISFTGSSLAGRAFSETEVTMTAGSSITGCGVTTSLPPPSCDTDNNDGKGKDCDGKDKDGDGHDKDKDKDHKDYSRHSFKDVSPFDMDEHGDKK